MSMKLDKVLNLTPRGADMLAHKRTDGSNIRRIYGLVRQAGKHAQGGRVYVSLAMVHAWLATDLPLWYWWKHVRRVDGPQLHGKGSKVPKKFKQYVATSQREFDHV